MNRELMGLTVKDGRSGLVGKVIGIVEWDAPQPPTLVVQPAARPDGTVPPTVYVQSATAEVVSSPSYRPGVIQ